MKNYDLREEKWIAYLTGDLSEDEMGRVEQEFLENDAAYEQLLALEDDLTYDFLQGKLSSPLNEKWQRRMNADPKRLEFASLLSTALDHKTSRSRSYVPTLWRVAAILFLAISGWLAYRFMQTQSEYQDLQNRYAEQQKQIQSIPKSSEPTISFMLLPGSQRSANGSRKLLVSKDENYVRLQLELKNDFKYDSYRAVIQTPEGNEVFSSNVSIAQTKIAILDLPVKNLPENDYQVILYAKKTGMEFQEIAYYSLPLRKS
jgi:hypothetical protein